MFSKVHICDAKIAYGLHFSGVMSFTKIIKDVDG